MIDLKKITLKEFDYDYHDGNILMDAETLTHIINSSASNDVKTVAKLLEENDIKIT